MKDRIKLIMESQRMTQQEFAQHIGMSPASLSSIFNDRTRPTLNIVEAIKNKFPGISLNWLMFGRGDMMEDGSISNLPPGSEGQPGKEAAEQLLDFEAADKPSGDMLDNKSVQTESVVYQRKSQPVEVKYIERPKRRIREIRVFYDDQTWETFSPTS